MKGGKCVKAQDHMNSFAYEIELSNIEEKIRVHRIQIEKLTGEKYKLLTKIQALDMDVVLQCIVEKGLTSYEVMEMINSSNLCH